MRLDVHHYILNERGEPVRCSDWRKWASWRQATDPAILRTTINELTILTVFLGLYFDDPPLLFETLIFFQFDPAKLLDYKKRYATRAEAIAGHTRAVDWVLAGVPS